MILSLLISAALAQPAEAAAPTTATNAVKENLSQLIRSNAVHYWSYVKTSTLAPYSQYEGIVAGDPHMGNFSVVPVENANGSRALRFVDIDFDDAGRGPLALDFARFVITVKVTNDDVKIPDLVKAYVDGLNGKRSTAPSRVQELVTMPIATYDDHDAKYVDHKTSHGKFKMEPGEIAPYNAKYSLSDITRLFPNQKVLDVATRPQDRGGSAGAIRIWVLTQDAGGKQQISEIKGYAPTSMTKFETQEAPQTLIKKVQAAFWPGLSTASYDLKTLAGDLVWVRPKKVPLLEFKNSDTIFVEQLAAYDANLLGLIHGRQSRPYVQAVNANIDVFKEGLKKLKTDYVDYADKTLR